MCSIKVYSDEQLFDSASPYRYWTSPCPDLTSSSSTSSEFSPQHQSSSLDKSFLTFGAGIDFVLPRIDDDIADEPCKYARIRNIDLDEGRICAASGLESHNGDSRTALATPLVVEYIDIVPSGDEEGDASTMICYTSHLVFDNTEDDETWSSSGVASKQLLVDSYTGRGGETAQISDTSRSSDSYCVAQVSYRY